MPRPAGTRRASAWTCRRRARDRRSSCWPRCCSGRRSRSIEVERLRDERLNDLLQAQADPRRRADETFIGTIYAPVIAVSPASGRHPRDRRAAGPPTSCGGPTSGSSIRRGRRSSSAATSAGRTSSRWPRDLFGRLVAARRAAAPSGPVVDRGAGDGRLVRVVHRPGSVQTEIRIGHPGLPRRVPDYHAVSVMSAILGGLFNSRLNMQLREAKGYTYGAGAGFDMRRGAGTVHRPRRGEHRSHGPGGRRHARRARADARRAGPWPELAAARDFLVGVFPLRFETPGAVVGALAGLAVHGLPLDELTDYRARIEAVDVDAVERAARDAPARRPSARSCSSATSTRSGRDLEAAGLGRLVIDRDERGVAAGAGAGDRRGRAQPMRATKPARPPARRTRRCPGIRRSGRRRYRRPPTGDG